MDKYKKYLADQILVEGNSVTYKLLSRTLEIHVNEAKRMLFDFHQTQNAQRVGTVHATYLVFGKRKSVKMEEPDEDTDMLEGHELHSEDAPISTLTLVGEEGLANLLESFEQVMSMHIYSLSANAPKDLQLLSNVSAQLPENEQAWENPARYGAINNVQVKVRRRTERSVEVSTKSEKARPPIIRSESSTQAKKESEAALQPISTSLDKKPASAIPPKATPVPKKATTYGIMQSFAKASARPKPQNAKSKDEIKDEPTMAIPSDDDEVDFVPATIHRPIGGDSERKPRKERLDQLRRMMNDEDDDDDDQGENDAESRPESPEPPDEQTGISEAPEESQPGQTGAEVRVEAGRRRGRRRIMKKKQIMDEQGYLVTIQEAAWESFSEDEAPRVPEAAEDSKPAVPAMSSIDSSKPGKKASGKTGQGNITSFFGRK